MLQVLNWIMSILAFFGTCLNAEKYRAGFYIWAVTNAYMAGLNFYLGIPSIGFLYVAYFIMAIRGLVVWKRKEKKD